MKIGLNRLPVHHLQRRGIALITVVMMLALATVLLLALLSTSQTELKSSSAYADGSTARMYANSAVSLVIGQIHKTTQQDAATSGMETWCSQPGMTRQIREDGKLLHGNKLYSSRKMSADTEAEIANDIAPADWDTKKDLYVDMNEPVVRYNANSPSTKPKVYFPIIDPRAFSTNANKTVEGFSYSTYSNGLSGPALDGVVLPGGPDADAQRVPMPVEWLYMLKDGTLGYLDPKTKKFVGADGTKASVSNPIVTRLAFWTDDESCKININTAGEGTSWDTPRLFHERDGEWARFQPMGYEYQRYPGHPATTCMSTVLFPNVPMNPLVIDAAAFSSASGIKEKIYDIMPKILPGGSKSGSVLVPPGRAFTPTDFAEVQKALGERLFASVDDFLLRPEVDGSGERAEIDLGSGGLWSGMDRSEVVERLRFFLTPRSRAPDQNPFGYPKIAMWPLHRINSSDYRTVFDQTIAKCSALAGKDYYFTRQNSNSQTELSGITRNKQLFDYLMKLTSLPIPGFGTTPLATFENKYGDNNQQILLEIFDYIRSTNLYDENISEKAVGANPSITGLPDARLTAYSAGMASKTFTPMRNSTGSSFPGHGQVTPTVLPKTKTEVYRGMGRFLTISEIGLHFICTAEGTDTAGGKSTPKIVAKTPPAAAGYTPPTWQGADWGIAKNWYSNFPPLTGANKSATNGFYKTSYPIKHNLEGVDGDKATHPGYDPVNWNWSLNKDQPLPDNTKRVQATILFEWFCPSTGWTLINPDLQLEVDASSLTVGGKKLFPFGGGKTIIRPYGHISNAWGVWMRGGTISYRAFLQGRKLPAIATGVNGCTNGSLVNDTSYTSTSSKGSFIKDCIQYNLVSDFFDMPADGKIDFDGGMVTVKILPTSAAASPLPLQTFNFNFPKAQFPAPILATKSEDTTWGQNWDSSYWVHQPVPAPYWWSFHADGVLGRTDAGAPNAKTPGVYGRFRSIGNEIGGYGNTPGAGNYNRGNLVIPDDTLQSLVLRHGDPRLTMGQWNVPDTEFEQHRLYGKQALAHNIVLAHWSQGPGLDQGLDKKGWRLVKDANYNSNFLPDHPYSPACGAGLQKYGDFDSGVGGQSDGAYINKPDEGNAYGAVNGTTGEQAVPYFTDSWVSWTGGPTYFSPNRQVASPGMFGSLPTGVHDAGTIGGKKREPWRTMLFRPQIWSAKNGQKFHIGAPKTLKGYGAAGLAIQGIDPPDYLYMDFFSMPVVEPYSISDPGSTAGKININYQIVPFRHIKRATGLAAVMKSEILTAVSFNDANVYLSRPGGAPANQGQSWFWKDDTSASGKKFWRRSIDLDATLKLFDERFRSGFAFVSPSQICEMYLLPKKGGSADTLVPDAWPDNIKDLLKVSGTNSILKFWEDHAITSDNLKEKPYTNIYPRLTSRSNTYQVYVRAQTIKKARSADPEKFEIEKDLVGAEYRGSAVIERYLDLNDPELAPGKNLDYAINPTGRQPLDFYHRYRVISEKRFAP